MTVVRVFHKGVKSYKVTIDKDKDFADPYSAAFKNDVILYVLQNYSNDIGLPNDRLTLERTMAALKPVETQRSSPCTSVKEFALTGGHYELELKLDGKDLLPSVEERLRALEMDKRDVKEILTKIQHDLANTQNDLANTQNDLANTQNDLANTQNDLTKTQNDLANTRSDLDHVLQGQEKILKAFKTHLGIFSQVVEEIEQDIQKFKTQRSKG